MALNFLTGSRPSEEEAPEATEPETTTTNTTDDEESPAPTRRRRGSRGGRSRSTSTAAAATESTEEEAAPPRRASSRRRASDDGEEAPPARPSRRRAPAAKAADDDEEAPRARPSRRRAPAAKTSDEDEAPKPRSTRRRAPAAQASEEEPEAPKRAAPRRRSRAAAAEDTGADGALLDALKEQTEQLARLVQLQERAIERLSGNGKAGVGTPRVGVFVDSANVELARDRTRGGRPIDWGLVLERVTKGRRLVRAIAYSPVHDDPGVSRETQRFVEPFLGKGFKIVTKPLKRFADGSIKANVDIELALDVITMADRLDIAVLASGDGDFQHLVEVLQSRGIRVEVAGLGQSVAGTLKNAADEYIELGFAQKK
jgi:uncharacterized LabA/DUF88 family protein